MKNSIIHDKLDKLQFDTAVETGKFLVVNSSNGGYGAQLATKVLGFKLAYFFNRTVIFDERTSCYVNCYEPTSSVSYDDISNLPQVKLDYNNQQTDQVVYCDFDDYWKNQRHFFNNWVPEELKRAGMDGRELVGQLLLRLVLKPQYQKYIADRKQELGFVSPIIGVHIRRGDKNTESPYVPLRIYEYYLKKAIKKTGIHRVFVASDSEDIFNHLPQIKGVEYLYDRTEKRYNNANEEMLKKNADIREEETKTALKIIDFLASCDYLVGQVNAHFTILASNLNLAQTGNKDNVSLVNRNCNDVYLNNDPNYFLAAMDLARKYGHRILLVVIRTIKPIIFRNKRIYNKLKSIYYRRQI